MPDDPDPGAPLCRCGRPLEPYGNGWLMCPFCDRPEPTEE